MLAPVCIRNALLIPEKNNTGQYSAKVKSDGAATGLSIYDVLLWLIQCTNICQKSTLFWHIKVGHIIFAINLLTLLKVKANVTRDFSYTVSCQYFITYAPTVLVSGL